MLSKTWELDFLDLLSFVLISRSQTKHNIHFLVDLYFRIGPPHNANSSSSISQVITRGGRDVEIVSKNPRNIQSGL